MFQDKSNWKRFKQIGQYTILKKIFKLNQLRKIICLSFFSFFVLSASSQSDPFVSVFWDLYNNNQIDKASEYIEMLIGNYPDETNYCFLRANVNLKKKNLEVVLSDIEKYLNKNPMSFEAYILKAEAYIELMQYDNAILSLYKAMDYAKMDVEKQHCNLKMGVVYVLQKNYKLGYDKLLRAHGIFSLNSEYLQYMGKAQLNLGLTEDAEVTRGLLLEMYPNEANTYAFQTAYYQNSGDYEEALKYLNLKISLDNGNANDYELLKRYSILTNDTLKLIQAYEEKLKLGEEVYLCNKNLADLYFSMHNYGKALYHINSAIGYDKDDIDNYVRKGEIYLESNLSSQACDCYFLALKKGYSSSKGNKILQTYIHNCEK